MATWKAGPKRENDQTLEAYRRYKDQGPGRSLSRLAAELRLAYGTNAPKESTLEKWSADLHWRDRLQQDEIRAEHEAERELVMKLVRRRRTLIEKRLDTLEVQLVGGFKALVETNKQGQAVPKDQSQMDPRVLHAVTTSVARAVQALRLEFGLPTEKLDVQIESLSPLSDPALPVLDIESLTDMHAFFVQGNKRLAQIDEELDDLDPDNSNVIDATA